MELQDWGVKSYLYNCVSADCINCPRSYPASADGFSIYSETAMEVDAIARYAPSGLESGFSGHPCPEIATYCTEYQENPIFRSQDNIGDILSHLPVSVFMCIF